MRSSSAREEKGRVTANPLDVAEEILAGNEWLHERASDEELAAEVEGKWCDYRLFFVWREETRALYFTCCFDTRVPDERRGEINDLLALINGKLWLGHFEVSVDDSIPMFRYTALCKGGHPTSSEVLEDLVNTAISECERFFPAFQFVIWGGQSAVQALGASMFETVGEA